MKVYHYILCLFCVGFGYAIAQIEAGYLYQKVIIETGGDLYKICDGLSKSK